MLTCIDELKVVSGLDTNVPIKEELRNRNRDN